MRILAEISIAIMFVPFLMERVAFCTFSDDRILFASSDEVLLAEGNERLVGFLEDVTKIGDIYAAKSSYDQAAVEVKDGVEERVSIEYATQIFLRDRKVNRWKTSEYGGFNNGTILRDAFFDGKGIWCRDSSSIVDFGGLGNWEPTKNLQGPFDPWTVWLCEPMFPSLSLEISVPEVFAGTVCVAGMKHSRGTEYVFAKKESKNHLNRVISLFFLDGQDLPTQYRIFASLMGDFDAKQVEQNSKAFSLEGKLVWQKIGKDKDIPALKEVAAKFHAPDIDSEMSARIDWLLEEGIPKEFLVDPRKEGARPLSELIFRKDSR